MYFDVCKYLTVSTNIPGIDSEEGTLPKIKKSHCTAENCRRRGNCVVAKDDETFKRVSHKTKIPKFIA